jgi:hypothetical protein
LQQKAVGGRRLAVPSHGSGALFGLPSSVNQSN